MLISFKCFKTVSPINSDFTFFPLDFISLCILSTSDFKKWYKVVEKHISKRVTYDDFVELICDLYKKNKQFIAQSKLMSLHFFYDTLRNHDKNIEFWSDLLYLGMKVGKRFAPHAKIS